MNRKSQVKSRFSRWTMIALTLTLLIGLLSACSRGNDPSKTDTSVVRIGVLYSDSDNEPYFRQQYTDMFEMQNPNIQFEIVGAINYEDQRYVQPEPGKEPEQPDPYEKMKEMLTGQNPVDVVVLDYNMLRRFNQDNLLQPLDPMIQKDKFDISDYVPTVIEGIKSVGDNNIYALTPTFSSAALYYNKKIFADMNIEPPTDKMDWEEIFSKARQVANGEGQDRVFGFSFNRWANDPFGDASNYSSALQLRTWDEKAETMLVNSDQWEKVWNTIYGLHKDKIVPDQQYMNEMYEKRSSTDAPYQPFFGDLFLSGNVAMMISESYYVNELRKASDNASKIKDFDMVDWDVVTVPVSSSNPGAGGYIGLSQLMGINAKAQNPEGAWEFIKFTNSKDWAKLKSRSNYELVARKEFLKPVGGLTYNIDAFTLLKPLPPVTNMDDNIYRNKPNIWQVQGIGQEMFQEVMNGTKDVKQALAEWETRGNALLQQPAGGEGDGTIEVMPMPRTMTEEEAIKAAAGEITIEEVPVDNVVVEE
ncbi:ABC transporter substrate-binding protein [Paenibacillus paeoniae]|uniref:Extracellular solute-binding protein n=1 Tax=Paenibacillus paeoniae TaxID=2292705 RepID=A0A371PJ96_9BACL|nr:extracellular solute-binding protein [Paenibacillus paeoniae]REK76281.1 extracellular solute-binding protein [Paenibacillus paeoniae]